MSEPPTSLPGSPAGIRELVTVVAARTAESDAAWERLRGLGAEAVPYLAEAFDGARRWQARAALLYYVIPYARVSEEAFQLGLRALQDRSSMVRYRACMVLAYSLRSDALPALEEACDHPDAHTAADARAALDAISHRNHHLFVDRARTGQTFWKVEPDDVRDS